MHFSHVTEGLRWVRLLKEQIVELRKEKS